MSAQQPAHTPGSWSEDGLAVVGPQPHLEICVCTVDEDASFGIGDEQARANARLIAAAPETAAELAALKVEIEPLRKNRETLLKICEAIGPVPIEEHERVKAVNKELQDRLAEEISRYTDLVKRMTDLRAAIAKAEGKAHA